MMTPAGRKCTPWEGGTRTAAVVSGGFLPPSLQGTRSQALVHVADWFATFSSIAGVNPSDPVHLNDDPTVTYDIDGEGCIR
jgi:arylsulfatase I/J